MLTKFDALRLENISSVGRTKPLIIECESTKDNESLRKIFLVKTIGLPEIVPSALYCEVLGNLFAREFGINTPEPAILHLSEEFIQTTKQILWERNIQLEKGLAVGCEYFSDGFTSVKSDMFLTKQQFEQATLIYGFDLLSQNPDRKSNNPNCAVRKDKVIAFDFEKSLNFIYPILGEIPMPWKLSKLGFISKDHVFSSNLKAKEKEIDWQPLIEKLKQITREKIEELCSFVPYEFGNYSDKICDHFASIVANIDEVKFELQRSLL